MAKPKYTRMIVQCSMFQASVLPNRKLPRGTVISGEDVAKLLAMNAEVTDDPKNKTAPLRWDPSSEVPDLDAVKARAAEAAKELEAIEKKAKELEAEKKAKAEDKAKELEAAAKAVGENTEAQILKGLPKSK